MEQIVKSFTVENIVLVTAIIELVVALIALFVRFKPKNDE